VNLPEGGLSELMSVSTAVEVWAVRVRIAP